MEVKRNRKAAIGIIRLKNASEIQSNMISRLHTIFPAEDEEVWMKQTALLADCILRAADEIQKSARKVKSAVEESGKARIGEVGSHDIE